MHIDLPTLVTILGMALATYATRASGLWLIGRIHLTKRAEAWLREIPGAVLVAIVAPTVFTTGVAEAAASLATVLVAARTRNLLLAMVCGVALVWALRTLLRLS